MRTYDELVSYLFSLRRFGMRPGLERVALVLHDLGDPHLGYPVIHVAGTKGKGSVSTFIASILQAAGYKVGLFTSPHLVSYTERFKINNNDISRKDLVRIAEKVIGVTERLKLKDDQRLTFFEISTVIAFEYFREHQVDFVILEVGMGGRLDATNVCKPLVAIVTNIDLEHTETLGDTREKIAFEKAGIIKNGCVAITAENRKEPLDVIDRICHERKVKLIKVGKDISYGTITNTLEPVHNTEDEICKIDENNISTFSVQGIIGDKYESLKIQLAGDHQIVNATTAIAAIETLMRKGINITERDIRKGLEKADIPCRFQLIRKNPTVILDNAHTISSACALRKTIDGVVKDKVILIFGVSDDKNIDGIIKTLAPCVKQLVVTKATNYRAAKISTIVKTASKYISYNHISNEMNVADAIRSTISKINAKNTVIVTGSSYVCGEALAYFKGTTIDGLTDSVKINKGADVGIPELIQDRAYIDKIFKELRKLYGEDITNGSMLASQAESENPFRVLIATILSHRTMDENTHKAVEKLFSEYRIPKDIATAPVRQLELLIHSTGFYHVKARNIRRVSQIIHQQYNDKVPNTEKELLSLPSVGRKTANCVLVYAFGKPAIPVDTHVHRISNRLGLVHTKKPEDTELELMKIIPRKYWLEINEYLVRFGKTICRPIGPKCFDCPLNKICPSSAMDKTGQV